jgi:hypothetical protein
MNTKLSELSFDELKNIINEAVDNRLEERLGDPDIGLDVKPEIIEKIRKSRRNKATLTADKTAEKLGLKW